MPFNVDMSPLERSGINQANALGSIGGAIGGLVKQNRMQAQEQEQQQQLQGLMQAAAQGDEQALDALYSINPQSAKQLEERQFTAEDRGIDAQERERETESRLKSQIALDTADAVEKIAFAKTDEEKTAMFNAYVDDDRFDIDEEDRQLFMLPEKQRALIAAVKGEEYADRLFAGDKVEADDNKFAPQVSALQVDPDSGEKYVVITNRNTGEVKRVDAPNAIGETLLQEQDRNFREASLGDARKLSKDSFDQLKGVKQQISTINEAITAIDKGASAGFFAKYMPSFRESTIALENAAQRMGLDVISATTFGALSEGELKLAMDTAMPKNLKPKELKTWLTERRTAKRKLANELSKMAITLGKGKTTVAEYLEKNASFTEQPEVTNKFSGFKVIR